MADKPLPFVFEKTLTQQGKPESLPACPCTWPEAKLIAPVLFPACNPAMLSGLSAQRMGMRVYSHFQCTVS